MFVRSVALRGLNNPRPVSRPHTNGFVSECSPNWDVRIYDLKMESGLHIKFTCSSGQVLRCLYVNTVSPLHMNLQVANFQRCECVHMSNHVSQFTCLAYIVTCVRPVRVVVLLCTLLYSTVQSTVVQYIYFKPRMSRSKRKSSSMYCTVLFKVLYYKIKNVFFIFCVFLCIICEKSIINHYSTVVYS